MVWAMTAYIFTGLKAELKDFRNLLNKVLLEHTILQTNYSVSVRDIQTINERLTKIDRDLSLTRERSHDLSNAIESLWGNANKNGWGLHCNAPRFRNDLNENRGE